MATDLTTGFTGVEQPSKQTGKETVGKEGNGPLQGGLKSLVGLNSLAGRLAVSGSAGPRVHLLYTVLMGSPGREGKNTTWVT